MSDNQLVPVKANLPVVHKKETNHILPTVMIYSQIDPLHYSFTRTHRLNRFSAISYILPGIHPVCRRYTS